MFPFCYILLLLAGSLKTSISSSIPNTQRCCRQRGVSQFCVQTLCNSEKPPNDFQVFEAAEQCAQFLPPISKCLANERNHMPCCKSTVTDADQQACFDLCDGTAKPLNTSHWELYKPYMTCLSFNIQSIYKCYRQGYSTNPGPPQELDATVTSTTSATIRWQRPKMYPQIVDKYIVEYGVDEPQMDHSKDEVINVETSQMEISIQNLRPDTKYFVHVVSSSNDGKHLSLKSDITHFVTKGVGPRLISYKSEVHGPLGTDPTLVCKVKVPGFEHRHLQIVWQKETKDGFKVLHYRTGPKKYRLTAYVASYRHQPRTYVSALQIIKVDSTDFGKYRCVARNSFGVGSTTIELKTNTISSVPQSPPNVTSCCERVGVHADCLDGCRQGAAALATMTHVGSSRMCALDITKVLACSMQGMDQGACCMRRKVPSHCLPFCDGTAEKAKPFALFTCLLHSTDIFSCHLEAKLVLPEAPGHVRLVQSDQNAKTAQIHWSKSNKADLYHVFVREKQKSKWKRTSVNEPEATLKGLNKDIIYEVTVVAANGSGKSEPSRTITISTETEQVDQADEPSSHRIRPARLRVATGMLEHDVVL